MVDHPKPALSRMAIVAGLVALAYLIRIVNKFNPTTTVSLVGDFTRSAIYLGLLAAWGILLRKRILRRRIRRYLTGIAVLMVFWIFVRSIKYLVVSDLTIQRYLWYLFFIPVLFLPAYFLFVSLSIGKPEDHRLPRWSRLISFFSGFLSILVLTNDLHQQTFLFANGVGPLAEAGYRYQWAYYVICLWIFGLAASTFVIVLLKTRIPGRRIYSLIPLLLMVLLLIYLVEYSVEDRSVRFWLGDFSVVTCLFLSSIIDSLIYSGLIPSNAYYVEIFSKASYVSAMILDNEYQVRYSSQNAKAFPLSMIKKAETGNIVMEEGKLLHNMPVTGGHALWLEDVSEITLLQQQLKEVRESLEEGNAMLRYRYAQEKEAKSIEEQNRLYDLLQTATQQQIDSISILVQQYQSAPEEERRTILAKIAVLCSFVKRRKHLTLSVYNSIAIAESELGAAIGECLETLRLLGVRSNKMIETQADYLPGEQITRAYDFFEDVIEASLDSLKTVLISVCVIEDTLRVGMNVRAKTDFSRLLLRYPSAEVINDEGDEWSLVLPIAKTKAPSLSLEDSKGESRHEDLC